VVLETAPVDTAYVWIPAPRFHEDKFRGNDRPEVQRGRSLFAEGLGVSPNFRIPLNPPLPKGD
jgi:hypothetical protein